MHALYDDHQRYAGRHRMTWSHVRSLFVVLLALALFPVTSFSQGFEISPFGGWMFAGSVRTSKGDLDLKNAGNYGGAIDISLEGPYKVEVSYTRMSTEIRFREAAPDRDYEFLTNTTVEYWQVGALAEQPRGRVIPFVLVTAGAAVFTPSDTKFESYSRFAMSLGVGVKLMLSTNFGLRLQGRLLAPMFFGGSSIYGGTGGLGFGVNAGIPILQGDFAAGLILKL